MRRSWLGGAVLSSAVLMSSNATAQDAAAVARTPAVRAARASIVRLEPATIEEQIELCQVPAPPFKEERRAQLYAEKMRKLGLRNVRIDAVGNVIGERPGAPGEPVIVVSAHLDTVFPEGTDVTVTRSGTVLKGPGIGDDCRGLAVLLAVVRALDSAHVATQGTLIFVGTVGEEGLGDLRGVRHLFATELKQRGVDYFVSIDGSGFDYVKDAVGSLRYKVTYKGPGGHSYGAFGTANPIHALGRAIASIAELQVPAQPKVTFNVGVIEGGTSVNAIPASASMLVDMRSADRVQLARIDSLFQTAVRDAARAENARWKNTTSVQVDVQTVGSRPAGGQSSETPIVRAIVGAAQAVGFTPTTEPGSTDANVPISLGVPAVTISAGGRGQGEHSLAETYDTAKSELGSEWVLLFVATLAGAR